MLDAVIAVGLAPVIRSLVNFLKPTWSKVDENLSPVISTVVACLLGTGLSVVWQAYQPTGAGIEATVALGILSGVAAVLYNDFRVMKVEPQSSGVVLVGEVTESSAPKAKRPKAPSKEKTTLKVGSVTPQQ